MLKIALTGAGGRMGRALIQALDEADDLRLAGALVRTDSPLLGKDAGLFAGLGNRGIAFSDDLPALLERCEVLIDFSAPELTLRAATASARAGRAFVTGTTGLAEDQRRELEAAAERIPLVFAPNMSVGVTLALRLLELTARVLDADYDVEIHEAHHRHKADAPSGTALRMGEVVATARGRTLDECGVYDRHGRSGAREPGSIGFAVTRAGEIVGEHTVMFAGPGERLEITHKASSRLNFARGALRAARWVSGKPPGFYSMQDVLGL